MVSVILIYKPRATSVSMKTAVIVKVINGLLSTLLNSSCSMCIVYTTSSAENKFRFPSVRLTTTTYNCYLLDSAIQ